MDNNIKIAYDALCAEEQNLLALLARKRQMIEQLAEELGETPPPMDMPLPMSDGLPATTTGQTTPSFVRGRSIQIRPTEFFTLKLAKAAMSYLERTQDKAASFPEILAALKQGGFPMKSGKAEEERLRLNLLKSTNFTLIPPNTFGLSSVYEKGKKRGGRKPNDAKGKATAGKKPKKEEVKT